MEAKPRRREKEGVVAMGNLIDVIAYIIKKIPSKDDLSNARTTKMIYLADWRHAITCGSTITAINWYFDNYGPFVWDIKQTAEENPDIFTIKATATPYGNPKLLLGLKDNNFNPQLSHDEKRSLDHVIEMTKDLPWSQFIRLVYSTFPIITSERYTYLDLANKAIEYSKYPQMVKV